MTFLVADSEQVGVTYVTCDGRPKPLVTVDDLRKKRKKERIQGRFASHGKSYLLYGVAGL